MGRPLCRQLLLIALAITATACSDNGATSTTSSIVSPSGTGVTEVFPSIGFATLTPNGAQSFPFTSTASGTIIATLTTFTPDTTLPVGLWLGVWDGIQCASGVVNGSAVQGSNVTAVAPSSGLWCVRIYDTSPSTVTQTETYQISVTHP